MEKLASKDFTAAKKVTSSGARPDDHWIKSIGGSKGAPFIQILGKKLAKW